MNDAIEDNRSKGDKGQASALYVWNGISLFWGGSFHTNPHAHETLQLVFDVNKQFLLKDESSEWKKYSSAIIQSSHIHQLDSNGSIQLFIYLDKDTKFAKSLSEKYLNHHNISSLSGSNIDHLGSDFFKKFMANIRCETLFMGCMEILKHLIDFELSDQKDVRIEKAVSFIATSHITPLKVSDIAEHVCLSESRLRHLFKAQVGQSIQNYMLWTKVVNSLTRVLKGDQLSHVAYETGFWDGSHMDKSYKELLGISPGAIEKYATELTIKACSKNHFYQFKTEILNPSKDEKTHINITT